MKNYLDLLRMVMTDGNVKSSRGKLLSDPEAVITTRSLFSLVAGYDLSQGFPLVTTKFVPWRTVAHELIWFISGSTNVKYLHDNKVRIWDEWIDKNGDLGPVYGAQWRRWGQTKNLVETGSQFSPPVEVIDQPGIDQLAILIKGLRENPDGRRHILSAWNVGSLSEMALPPCHILSQFYVANGKLSASLYQRSGDMFLGIPFNIASYALLTCMLAHVLGLKPGTFTHIIGDAHVYMNHEDAVREQLTREPKPLPSLWLNPEITDITKFTIADIRVDGYDHDHKLSGEVVV